jgi:hypothetical protein
MVMMQDDKSGADGTAPAADEVAANRAAPVARAKTSNSVKKKRARRAADRKCRQQVAQCQTSLAGLGAPPEIIACCELLRTCNLAGFFDCVTS